MPSESYDQFRKELQSLIRRHSHESELTVGEVVQALEVEKFAVLMSEENHFRDNGEPPTH